MSLIQRLEEAAQAILRRCEELPSTVLVLGSGLNGLVDRLQKEVEIPYAEIPHFKPSTAPGHVGKLVVGKLNGTRVTVMQGRLHYFEGYSMSEVVFPVRVLAKAGASSFVLTNASGGLRTEMSPGDLYLVTDHINFMGNNPLIGPNDESLGPRFPELNDLYDPELNRLLKESAQRQKIKLGEGVYVAVHGPSFETPAEVRLFRQLGADLSGMSTVPEAIALRHMGKKVVVISCVTNLAAGLTSEPPNHEEVLMNAKKAYDSIAPIG